MATREIPIPAGTLGSRLDKFLTKEGITHGKLEKLIKNGCVLVETANGATTLVKKCGLVIHGGDVVKIQEQDQPTAPQSQLSARLGRRGSKKGTDSGSSSASGAASTAAIPPLPDGLPPSAVVPSASTEELPVRIVFEDDDIMVVDKPAGMAVHPRAGDRATGTLVDFLTRHTNGRLSTFENDPLRPGIVHRIDKETSGLVVVAKVNAAHAALQPQLESHSMGRRYSALVWGAFTPLEIQHARELYLQHVRREEEEAAARRGEAEDDEQSGSEGSVEGAVGGERGSGRRKGEPAGREEKTRQPSRAPENDEIDIAGGDESASVSAASYSSCSSGSRAGGPRIPGGKQAAMRAAALAAPPSTGQAPALSAVGATSNVNGVEGMEGTLDGAIGRHPAKGNKRAVVDGTERSRAHKREPNTMYSGARRAVTHFTVVRSFPFATLLDITLETGRPNQIRVHMQSTGHPVFGDPLYGGRNRVGRGVARLQIANIPPEYRALCTELLASVRRQCLHARSLAFNHPTTGIPLAFESPLPADFAGVVARLEAAYGGAKKASQ